jgi:hypothetical protein
MEQDSSSFGAVDDNNRSDLRDQDENEDGNEAAEQLSLREAYECW